MARRYVVARRRTGFGDCIWSLAAAWQYAKRTGRILVIDWTGSCYTRDSETNAFTQFFNPIDEIAGVPVILAGGGENLRLPGPFFPEWWNGHWGEKRGDQQVLFERDQLRRLFATGQDCAAATVICDACLMWGCDEWAENVIFDELDVVERIRDKISAYRRDNFDGCKVIGVHIRHGNGEDIQDHWPYWAEPERLMRLVEGKMRSERLRVESEMVKYFLSTDSIFVLNSIVRVFPGVMYTEKEYRRLGAGPLHCPQLGPAGGEAALVDMYLLAMCDVLIRVPPTSAFSRMAYLRVPRVFECDLRDSTGFRLA
ncbi:nodulation protein NodZ [Azorhizobium doebereinerae]|uniref:nodulation protein NodZ n=1 Tax=Azorhizobium doebereinerae TaxID=281091 RepID=UPI0012EB9BB8|nr:nodulation protein NodZ [Azorhizobium doebereinerae]